MFKQSLVSSTVVAVAMAGAICSAQTVTSARSGTLHYLEGDVSIDGTPVQAKFGKFQEIKDQGVLTTKLGRAEVLLTPGVFLRIGENSSIKMIDTRLVSTRVDVLAGNVMLESDDAQMDIKDSPVVLIYKDYEIRMQKHGLAELNTDPGQLKVFKGEALVETAEGAGTKNRTTVKEGRLVSFNAALVTEKFDDKVGDELYLWARDRSQVLSAANMSSARSLSSCYASCVGSGSGYGYGGLTSGIGGWNGGWYYNPYFGMYTYVPLNGTLWNPWGYGFFSPNTIYSYYSPTAYWSGGGGAMGASARGRPVLGGVNSSSNRAAPLGQLLNSNSGRINTLGSPTRGANAFGTAPPAIGSSSPAASGGGFAPSRGSSGGGASMASSPAASSGGGHSSGGGGHR
jgi:hypothetical protein